MGTNLKELRSDDVIMVKRKDHAGFYNQEWITYEDFLKQLHKDLNISEI